MNSKPSTQNQHTRFIPVALVILLTCSAMTITPSASAGTLDSLIDSLTEPANPVEALAGTGIYFEENLGQFHPDALFKVHGTGIAAFLTHTGSAFVLAEAIEDDTDPLDSLFEAPEPAERAMHAVFLNFTDGNPDPITLTKEPLPGISNYFIGNDPANWVTNVPHAERVVLLDVWPGIDIEWYGQEGKGLKFDAVVHPGADPDQVQFTVEGADELEVDAEGRLVMDTSLGVLIKDAPFTYQEAETGVPVEVASSYATSADETFRFEIGGYDPSRALVIDPLVYSTFVGSSNADYPRAISVDASGDAYIAGYTSSASFPTTSGAYQTSFAGGAHEAFVSKLSSTGMGLVYSTYLGGHLNEEAHGIAVDSSGSAYVVGRTGSGFPITSGAYQTSYGGGFDAFVTKISPSGASLVYSTYLGGGEFESAQDVSVDANGNAYVTGGTGSRDFPTTSGAYRPTLMDDSNAFVTKLSSTGANLVYSTYFGGTTGDGGEGIAVNADGEAYVTGRTWSTNFPTTTGAYQTSYGGGLVDAFVTKFTSTGADLVYSTYLGGGSLDEGYGIAVDAGGDAYVTGKTSSTDYPTTSGAYQTSKKGTADAFVTKLSNTGAAVYSTYIGGSSSDAGYDVAVDASGDAYVTGETRSSDYPTTSGAYQTSYHGGFGDVFVTRFTSTGADILYSTYLGGNAKDFAYGIAVDANGDAYVTGETESTDYPTTSGAYQTSHAGGTQDAFVSKICMDRPLVPVITSSTHPLVSRFYSAATFEVSWDAACAVDHRYELRSSTCPSAISGGVLTTSKSQSFAGLGPFAEHWFCLQSRDPLGNWGPVVSHHFGVDTVDPEFDTTLQRPLPGQSVDDPLHDIRIDYHDKDIVGGIEQDPRSPSSKTEVDAPEVTFLVDGVDMRAAWENICAPKGPVADCRLEITSGQLLYEPLVPWSHGTHVISVGIQDEVEGANTASTSWNFVVDALPEFDHDAGCTPLVPMPGDTVTCFAWVEVNGQRVIDESHSETVPEQPTIDYDAGCTPLVPTPGDTVTCHAWVEIDGQRVIDESYTETVPSQPTVDYDAGCTPLLPGPGDTVNCFAWVEIDGNRVIDESHSETVPMVPNLDYDAGCTPLAPGPGDDVTCFAWVEIDGQRVIDESHSETLPGTSPGDADGDGVPDELEAQLCGRPLIQTLIETAGAGECVTSSDYVPPDTAMTVTIPVGVTLGPDADGDGVPADVTLHQLEITIDPLASPPVSTQPGPDIVQVVDPDDTDENNPVPFDQVPETFTVPVPVPVGATPGADADGDGVPADVTLHFVEITIDRTDPLNPAKLNPAPDQTHTIDPDDTDENNPVPYDQMPETVTVTVPTGVTVGPDGDNDGLPADVTIHYTDVTIDRTNPLNPVSMAPAPDTVLSVDPDDEDRDNPGPVDTLDGDGDFIPDAAEPWICQVQDRNTDLDGRCVRADGSGSDGDGDNYVPPVPVPNPWNM